MFVLSCRFNIPNKALYRKKPFTLSEVRKAFLYRILYQRHTFTLPTTFCSRIIMVCKILILAFMSVYISF